MFTFYESSVEVYLGMRLCLIFSFSSGALPAHHTVRAGGYYHYVFIHNLAVYFLQTNMMPGGSSLAIRHCKRLLLDSVQHRDTFVSVAFIDMLILFVPTSLVHENKKYISQKIHAMPMMIKTREIFVIIS